MAAAWDTERRPYNLDVALTETQQKVAKALYPDVRLVPTPNARPHTHGVSKFERERVETFAYQKLQQFLTPADRVLDIGGNEHRHVRANRGNVWCCNPVLNVYDAVHYEKDQLLPRGYSCNHKANECNCFPWDAALAVHSLYYLSEEEIVELVHTLRTGLLVAVLHDCSEPFGQWWAGEGSYYRRADGKVNATINGTGFNWVHEDHTPKLRKGVLRSYRTGIPLAAVVQLNRSYGHSDIWEIMAVRGPAVPPANDVAPPLFETCVDDPAYWGPVNFQSHAITGARKAVKFETLQEAVTGRGPRTLGEQMWDFLGQFALFKATDMLWSFKDNFALWLDPAARPIVIPKGMVAMVRISLLAAPRDPKAFQTAAFNARKWAIEANMDPEAAYHAALWAATLGFTTGLKYENNAMATLSSHADEATTHAANLKLSFPSTWADVVPVKTLGCAVTLLLAYLRRRRALPAPQANILSLVKPFPTFSMEHYALTAAFNFVLWPALEESFKRLHPLCCHGLIWSEFLARPLSTVYDVLAAIGVAVMHYVWASQNFPMGVFLHGLHNMVVTSAMFSSAVGLPLDSMTYPTIAPHVVTEAVGPVQDRTIGDELIDWSLKARDKDRKAWERVEELHQKALEVARLADSSQPTASLLDTLGTIPWRTILGFTVAGLAAHFIKQALRPPSFPGSHTGTVFGPVRPTTGNPAPFVGMITKYVDTPLRWCRSLQARAREWLFPNHPWAVDARDLHEQRSHIYNERTENKISDSQSVPPSVRPPLIFDPPPKPQDEKAKVKIDPLEKLPSGTGLGAFGYHDPDRPMGIADISAQKNAEHSVKGRITNEQPPFNPDTMADYHTFVRRHVKDIFGDSGPMPSASFATWNSRFSAARQAAHVRAKQAVDLFGMPDRSDVCKMFPKREKIDVSAPLRYEEKYPRAIQGRTDEENVVTGPFFWAVSNRVKATCTWAHHFAYASGMTGEELGAFFQINYEDRHFTDIFSDDASLYDHTINVGLMEAERIFLESLTPPRAIMDWMMKRLDGIKGASRTGVKYVASAQRCSGEAGTSVLNSFTNIMTHAYAICRVAHWDPNDKRGFPFSMVVMGDDNLFLTRPGLLDDAGFAHVERILTELGTIPKLQRVRHPGEAVFCQMRFWPCESFELSRKYTYASVQAVQPDVIDASTNADEVSDNTLTAAKYATFPADVNMPHAIGSHMRSNVVRLPQRDDFIQSFRDAIGTVIPESKQEAIFAGDVAKTAIKAAEYNDAWPVHAGPTPRVFVEGVHMEDDDEKLPPSTATKGRMPHSADLAGPNMLVTAQYYGPKALTYRVHYCAAPRPGRLFLRLGYCEQPKMNVLEWLRGVAMSLANDVAHVPGARQLINSILSHTKGMKGIVPVDDEYRIHARVPHAPSPATQAMFEAIYGLRDADIVNFAQTLRHIPPPAEIKHVVFQTCIAVDN